MIASLVTISPETDIEDCEKQMRAHQARRILVLDADGRCCSIISQADIAMQSGDRQKTAEVVEGISKPGTVEAR